MANESKLKSTQGAIFIQRDGANTRPYYLPETDLDDLEEGLGGIELIQSFDVYGRRTTLGHTQDAPEPIGTTLTTYLGELADELDRLKGCPFPIYVLMSCAGRRDVFTNYRRAFLLTTAIPTSKTVMGLARRNEEIPSEHSVEIEAYPPLWRVFELNDGRVSLASTPSVNQVTFCGEFRCASYCAEPSTVCKEGYYVTDRTVSGSVDGEAVVAYTDDGGATWTATAADPFAAGEDISSVQCFRIGSSTTRVIVARGVGDVANPAEIAYSDDGGATWTNVNVGSTNNAFITKIFAINLYNIWCVTSNGYIFYSEDGGVTWTAQESGIITSNDYLDIHFMDELYGVAVGQGDIIAITRDGGDTWSAAGGDTGTGADITSVFVHTSNRFWIGTDDGELFYTKDYGDTFAQRTFSGSGTGTVTAMDWLNEFIGVVVHNNGTNVGRVLFTFNGGFDWQVYTTGATAGLNSAFICEPHLVFTAGEAVGSLSTLIKLSASF